MHKYKMINEQDYRQGKGSGHGVQLIERNLNGEEWAYGEFATIDADMLVSDKAVEVGVPQTITKLQAMKQMKVIGKWETFKTVLASDEDSNDEWLLSDNLNRTYPLVLGIGQMFEFTDTDLDNFFIEASKL